MWQRFARVARRAYETAPRDWVRWAEIRTGRRDALQEIDALFGHKKHGRTQRHFDFLNRYETIVARHQAWEPLDFEKAQVLEIGCGPLAGFGPLAVFRGCAAFHALDPGFDPRALDRPGFETYLRNIHKDLSALYGERLSFEAFRQAVRERIKVHRSTIEQTDLGAPIDITLSNSCLEHVHPLDATLKHLHRATAPGGRFLHAVDFGNHRAGAQPFSGLYTQAPEDYRRGRADDLNLLRAPDILEQFAAAGFQASLVPYFSQPEDYDEVIAPWWREHYQEADLFLKVGLFVGTA